MAVHFEIHVNDAKIAKDFYTGLFGWSYQEMPEAGDYHLVIGDDVGVGKALSGAIMARNAPAHEVHTGPRGAILVFDVEDTDATYAKALATGGSEALPPTSLEGVGRFAYVEDGQGNLVGFIKSEDGAA